MISSFNLTFIGIMVLYTLKKEGIVCLILSLKMMLIVNYLFKNI